MPAVLLLLFAVDSLGTGEGEGCPKITAGGPGSGPPGVAGQPMLHEQDAPCDPELLAPNPLLNKLSPLTLHPPPP